ncbi:MAG TPA: hypothetical protein VFW11_24015 [Cyclobacteriaceae bacterium]|nr:hypothetical protein [Cyclobacteriaceae bacterium]
MKHRFENKVLAFSVSVITVLLVLNIIITHHNNNILEHNRNLQKEAEQVKVTISQFAIVIIHNLDLGLRSYALYGKKKYLTPLRFAIEYKDSILGMAEESLRQQQYPLKEFYELKDSIIAYEALCLRLLELYEAKDTAEFNRLSDQDKGYLLWLQYERFSKGVNEFEDQINESAQRKYLAALRNNYLVQISLLLISVPTLFFTFVHTKRKFAVETALRKAEIEKAELLASQNQLLEKAVAERTVEIQTKNKQLQEQYDEIAAANEEISAQNDELTLHREELSRRNRALEESKRRELDLYKVNLLEKSEMIRAISQELEILKGKFSPTPEQIQKFNNILHFSIATDEDWEQFKKAFQEVYPTFFANLRFRFAAITASELRLAALIKMNLSLREAADMLGISSESVKKSRYRLKKRLGLVDEESLEDFVRTLN